jgi:hypothetical protein
MEGKRVHPISMNDKKTFQVVAGDFALSALAIRLLAPDPQSLLRHMPDARPGQSIFEWEKFSSGIDWTHEAQSVLYVANFVHEFVHLLQHTTLYQCMLQVHTIHSLAWSTMSTLMELKDSQRMGAWPPQLPLLPWILNVEQEKGESLWKEWIQTDAYFKLYAGNEEFAQDYCDTVGEPIENVFVKPFNPRIGHLARSPSDPLAKFSVLAITTRMLLETQATAFEYRFMSSFYGEHMAQQLIGGFPNAPLRPDYDVLHIVAIGDGLGYLLPCLIDWAFMGPTYLLEEPARPQLDYSAVHPAWRFTRLYNAAGKLVREGRLPKGRELWDALKDIRPLQQAVYQAAGLSIDNIDLVANWVDTLPDSPLKSVFQMNLAGRRDCPEAYASLEAFLTPIQAWTCTPLVLFRRNPLAHYHPGKRLDTLSQIRLDEFAKRIFEINRMVEGTRPYCPFCVGIGDGGKLAPAVGGQTWGAGEDWASSECHCGWAFGFKSTWGVAPEDIKLMEHGGAG